MLGIGNPYFLKKFKVSMTIKTAILNVPNLKTVVIEESPSILDWTFNNNKEIILTNNLYIKYDTFKW